MAKSVTLKCFKASFNGMTDEGNLPSRLKIFDWGKNKTSEGDFIVDDATVRVFAENQQKMGRETIAVDFNHSSVEGTAAFEAAKGTPDIAGYAVPVIVPGKGIFMEGVETTPLGCEKAANFKDLSPTPFVDEKTGRVLGLHSCALVPAGATYGLTVESAALKALSAQFKTLSVPDSKFMASPASSEPNAYKGKEPYAYPLMKEEHFTAIKDAMGMPDDCSYEDVMEKLKATFEKKGGKTGPLDSPHEGTAIVEKTLAALLPDALGAVIKPLQAAIDGFKAEVEATKKAGEETERASLLAQAAKDGKVIPLSADTLKTIPLAALKEMVPNLKKDVVPLSAIKPVSSLKTLSADRFKSDGRPTLADAASAIESQIRAMPNGELLLNKN